MAYYQLFYNASMASLSGNPGFGIRTVTEGLPDDLLESLQENSQLYFYSSGKFRSDMDSLFTNPESIYENPKRFYYKTIASKNGRTYYLLGRIVAAGFDYPFYESGKPCRTGNIVAHIFIFEELPEAEIFNLLYESPAEGSWAFAPKDYTPRIDNEEMRFLMVGQPSRLPVEAKPFDTTHKSYGKEALDLLFSYRKSWVVGRPLFVKTKTDAAAVLCAEMLSLLPAEIGMQTTFETNYQNEGVPKDARMLFVNEYYLYPIYSQLCDSIDLVAGSRQPDKIESMWRPLLEDAVARQDMAGVRKLCSHIFSRTAEENVDAPEELNRALFNYIYSEENFFIESVDKVQGLLPALAKCIASGQTGTARLENLLMDEFGHSECTDDFRMVMGLCEKVLGSGIVLGNKLFRKSKDTLTTYMLTSYANMTDAICGLDAALLKKYCDVVRLPELTAEVFGKIIMSEKEQVRTFTAISFLEPNPENRVKVYLEYLKCNDAGFEKVEYMLDRDSSVSSQLDYLEEFAQHLDKCHIAPLLYRQCRKHIAERPVKDMIVTFKELSDKNMAFRNILLRNEDDYSVLYEKMYGELKSGDRNDCSKDIEKYILSILPENGSIRKRWYTLYSVLVSEKPDGDFREYYNIALELDMEQSLRCVAPLCFDMFKEEEETSIFMKTVKKYALMSEEDILAAIKGIKDKQRRTIYLKELAKAYDYDYDTVVSCIKIIGIKDDIKTYMKEEFPKQYRKHRNENAMEKIKSIFKKPEKTVGMICILLMLGMSVSAKEYGKNVSGSSLRYFVTSGTVPVREQASPSGTILYRVEAGDVIYPESDTIIQSVGEEWVQISGETAYIQAIRLTAEANPNYVPAIKDSGIKVRKSIFTLSFGGEGGIPKWLGITMFSVWMLLSLLACLGVAGFLPLSRNRFPLLSKYGNLDDASKYRMYGEGMRKLPFMTADSYITFISFSVAVLLSFVATILLFIVLGGATWLVTWIGHILLVILFWLLAIVGCAGGLLVFGVFSSDIDGCLAKIGCALGAAFSVFIAIITISNKSWFYSAGASMSDWGTQVFTTFNVFKESVFIFKTYGMTALAVALIPPALFLVCAIGFLLFAGIVIAYEKSVLRKYNMSHPCPICGHPSEPAGYFSHRQPLPVKLQPGAWGLFHIKHPGTGEKMPTLFLNGKDRLDRRCCHCDGLISSKAGIEKHIAMIGPRSSGKTTLMCRIISELIRMKIDEVGGICRFTDSGNQESLDIMQYVEAFNDGREIKSHIKQTDRGRHRAIQLLVDNPRAVFPYRLFVNDVAGETFEAGKGVADDVSFLMNSNVIIFLIDPTGIKTGDLDVSPRFAEWYKKNVGDLKSVSGKTDLSETADAFINFQKKYRDKKDMPKISVMFTFVKTDTGYLDGVDANDDDALRRFAEDDMGLGFILHKFNGFSISFHAVSAVEEVSENSSIKGFVDDVLDGIGVSFKGVTAKKLEASHAAYKKEQDKIAKEEQRYEGYEKKADEQYAENVKWYHGNGFQPTRADSKNSSGVVGLLIYVLAIVIGLVIYVPVSRNIQDKNYNGTLAVLEQIQTQPIYYNEALTCIEKALETKHMSQIQQGELNSRYLQISKDRKVQMARLQSRLYANCEPGAKGRVSNLETSMKYRAEDNVRMITDMISELGALDPLNSYYLKYSEMYEKLSTKYGFKTDNVK